MTECLFTDEILAVVFQLFHIENMAQVEEWRVLSPIQLAVLSWHLGNFYFCPCDEAVPSLVYNESRQSMAAGVH